MSRILVTMFVVFLGWAGERNGGSAGPIQLMEPAPQTAEEIVARHIQALGGKEKLQGLNSIYLQGIAVLPSGLEIKAQTWRVYDRLYRMQLDFGESHVTIIATPSRAWTANPKTNGKYEAVTGEDLKALKVEIDPAGPLADYSAKGFKIERAGIDTVAGELCYKIKVSCPSNHSVTYSIDEKNFYVLKEVRRGGGILCGGNIGAPWGGPNNDEVTIHYGDHRKGPGGYILPYSINVSGMGAPILIQKVEINKAVDTDALGKPDSRR